MEAVAARTSASLGGLAHPRATAPSSSRFLLKAAPTLRVQPLRKQGNASSRPLVRAAVEAPPKQQYELPTWTEFEIGVAAVYWETSTGRTASSGELLTMWFNPDAASLSPSPDFGVGFNGGFNSPIMCGGEPRQMTRKDRGPNCTPFYSIKINVPVYAKSLEFSFTDGATWHGPYKLEFEVPSKFRSQPMSFFNEKLKEEMSTDSACEEAIFPDSAYMQDRCLLPGGLGQESGQSCELNIVSGCMDTNSVAYDPLAVVDDGSCEIDVAAKK